MDKENQKRRLSQKMANEKGKLEMEMQIKLWEQKQKMEVRFDRKLSREYD
jgi:hypothetical protein